MRCALQIYHHASNLGGSICHYTLPAVRALIQNKKVNDAISNAAIFALGNVANRITRKLGFDDGESKNYEIITQALKESFPELFSKIDLKDANQVSKQIKELVKIFNSYKSNSNILAETSKKTESILNSPNIKNEVRRSMYEAGLEKIPLINQTNKENVIVYLINWLDGSRYCHQSLVESSFQLENLKKQKEINKKDLSTCLAKNEKANQENKEIREEKDRKIEEVRDVKDKENRNQQKTHKTELENMQKTHKTELENMGKTHKTEIEDMQKTHKTELEELRKSKDQTISNQQKENTGCLIEKHACVVELEKRKQNWIFC
jgi:hypothetical protein